MVWGIGGLQKNGADVGGCWLFCGEVRREVPDGAAGMIDGIVEG